jgi:hypothetical protein
MVRVHLFVSSAVDGTGEPSGHMSMQNSSMGSRSNNFFLAMTPGVGKWAYCEEVGICNRSIIPECRVLSEISGLGMNQDDGTNSRMSLKFTQKK